MGLTHHGFPYPESSNPRDFPADMRKLATWADVKHSEVAAELGAVLGGINPSVLADLITYWPQVSATDSAVAALAGAPGTATRGALEALVDSVMRTVRPEEFGAVGDATTDDYPAFRAMVAHVNNVGGYVRILLTPGRNYYLNRHFTTPSATVHITVRNVDYLEIDFSGATISVKGDIHHQTGVMATCPLSVEHCGQVFIHGGVLDGRNHLSTRAPSPYMVHAWSAGMRVGACRDVRIQDMLIRRFASDGIMLRPEAGGGLSVANKRVVMSNVVVRENGRNNASFTGNESVTCYNCDFSDAGRVFAGSAPYAGIDIEDEPFYGPFDIPSCTYSFIACTFRNNIGTADLAEIWSTQQNPYKAIGFDNCIFDYRDLNTRKRIAGASDVTFNQCHFFNAQISPFFGTPGGATEAERSRIMVTIRGGRMSMTVPVRFFEYSVAAASPVWDVDGVHFRMETTSAATGSNVLFWAVGPAVGAAGDPRSSMRNCRIWVDGRVHTEDTTTVLARFQGWRLENNIWDTDYTGAGFFQVNATGSVQSDRRLSPAIRRVVGDVLGDRLGDAVQTVTVASNLGVANGQVQHRAGGNAPTTGAWNRGTVIWNNQPNAGGVLGWVCVVAGEPGTWRAIGTIAA